MISQLPSNEYSVYMFPKEPPNSINARQSPLKNQ